MVHIETVVAFHDAFVSHNFDTGITERRARGYRHRADRAVGERETDRSIALHPPRLGVAGCNRGDRDNVVRQQESERVEAMNTHIADGAAASDLRIVDPGTRYLGSVITELRPGQRRLANPALRNPLANEPQAAAEAEILRDTEECLRGLRRSQHLLDLAS